ncbi:MAG TPA: M23 family metallopeptidase [Thermoanaerobaculia bacterium]|nr:M23 family metallopeptidase [Thermoanaerobaculia bacterium]
MRGEAKRRGPVLRMGCGCGLLVVALVALAGVMGWGPAPEVEIATEAKGIGPATPVAVAVREPLRGLELVRVLLRQGEQEEVVAEKEFTPRPLWQVWGERTPEATLQVELGKQAQPWLVNGEATIRVVATRPAGVLRQPAPVVEELTLPVRVTPPTLSVMSTQHYVAQGGSEVVVYRVGEEAARDGVLSGDDFYRGYPLPGQQGVSFALFGVAYDMGDRERIRLVAEDELGNRAERAFVDRFTPKPIPVSKIELSDPFLQKVVPEIAAHSPHVGATDDLAAAYVVINDQLRERNRRQLIEIAGQSKPQFLWRQHFLPFPSGQVMSAFAVRRHYFYDGEKIDEQTHLGFDLASTQQAPVPAANDGVVLWASYLGIYGNVVILDHGYGLLSLYAHLSSIDAQEGQQVERGQSLGRTGATGLAGGDHLHFATLLQGVPVTPVEWWDAHWIQDRIDRKLGAALPFGNPAAAAGQAAAGTGE